jgi:hypothetical protein
MRFFLVSSRTVITGPSLQRALKAKNDNALPPSSPCYMSADLPNTVIPVNGRPAHVKPRKAVTETAESTKGAVALLVSELHMSYGETEPVIQKQGTGTEGSGVACCVTEPASCHNFRCLWEGKSGVQCFCALGREHSLRIADGQ